MIGEIMANSKNQLLPGLGTHHIAVQTRDWEASLKLYRDVLGTEIVADFEGASPKRRILLLDIGDGSHMELFDTYDGSPKPGNDIPNDPIFHFALTVDDTRSATERVRTAGYEITVEPVTVTLDKLEVTLSFFNGPNGEVIEFFQVH